MFGEGRWLLVIVLIVSVRLIYATALAQGLPFVSADRAMRAVDPAIIW